MTKKYKTLWIILSIISFGLIFGPITAYAAIGFATASTAGQCALLSCISVGTIISAVCALNKYTPRSRMFIFLLGFYFALEHFLPCIMVIGAATIVDEFIICPLKHRFRNLYVINKEIDKRIP